MKGLETLQGSRTGHGSTVPRQSMVLSVLGTRHQTQQHQLLPGTYMQYMRVRTCDVYKCTADRWIQVHTGPATCAACQRTSRHPQVVVRFLLAFSPTSFLCLSDLEVSAHISAALVEHEAQQRLTPSCELFFGSSFTFY